MKRLFFALSLLLLAACGAKDGDKVIVKNEPFSRDFEIDGQWNEYNPLRFTGKNKDMAIHWELRSYVNKTTRTVHHEVFIIYRHYTDMKYFTHAADENAVPLPLKEIYHSGGHCSGESCERIEQVVVLVTDAALRKHAETGYHIKTYAKSGYKFVVTITPEMIHKQLQTVDSLAPNHENNHLPAVKPEI